MVARPPGRAFRLREGFDDLTATLLAAGGAPRSPTSLTTMAMRLRPLRARNLEPRPGLVYRRGTSVHRASNRTPRRQIMAPHMSTCLGEAWSWRGVEVPMRPGDHPRAAGCCHARVSARVPDPKPTQVGSPRRTTRSEHLDWKHSSRRSFSRAATFLRPALKTQRADVRFGWRRDKAALSSGCKSRPATAPAGSNRSRLTDHH